ncbi:MAG: TlpA family protein disulfide reductase [Gammaproteobacteria bacterium]|nr:TlpA family protein disulfide reductase [Gammaproteobacteria bacterium]
MSFFNKHFFVGMVAGAVALAGLGMIGMFTLLAIVGASGGTGPGSIAIASGLRVPDFPSGNQPVIEWQLTDLDGNQTDLAAMQEKVVFVNMWATWCAPCLTEMPTIERLASEFADQDMAFLIVSREPHETVAPFVDDRGWDLPIFTAKRVPPTFQTGGIPATFVLDEKRRVVFSHVGSALWDAETAIEYFDRLLGL